MVCAPRRSPKHDAGEEFFELKTRGELICAHRVLLISKQMPNGSAVMIIRGDANVDVDTIDKIALKRGGNYISYRENIKNQINN